MTAIVPQSGDRSSAQFAVTPRWDLLATASTADPVRVFDLNPSDDRTIGPFPRGDRRGHRHSGRPMDDAHADGTVRRCRRPQRDAHPPRWQTCLPDGPWPGEGRR
jgi:hypothetical protein